MKLQMSPVVYCDVQIERAVFRLALQIVGLLVGVPLHCITHGASKFRWSLLSDLFSPFLNKTPYYHGIRRPASSFVRNKVRQSYTSRTVWTRITEFYTGIHTGRLYNLAGYDVTGYFRLVQKMQHPTVWVEFLENGHEILHAYRRQLAPQTCQIQRH